MPTKSKIETRVHERLAVLEKSRILKIKLMDKAADQTSRLQQELAIEDAQVATLVALLENDKDDAAPMAAENADQ